MATNRRAGLGDGLAEVFEFLLDEKSDRPRLARQRLRHAERAGVLAMGGAEGIIDVDIADLGKLLGKLRVVLLFLLVETNVFQEKDFAVL